MNKTTKPIAGVRPNKLLEAALPSIIEENEEDVLVCLGVSDFAVETSDFGIGASDFAVGALPDVRGINGVME